MGDMEKFQIHHIHKLNSEVKRLERQLTTPTSVPAQTHQNHTVTAPSCLGQRSWTEEVQVCKGIEEGTGDF